MYYSDGNMFEGHSIVLSGNVNGEFKYAEMAG
ncbi:DUF2262 domain-containing protein [Clostridium sp. ZBS12]|nr:DUF2262 domain-containing protein [Clostridium sp. ZBS12]